MIKILSGDPYHLRVRKNSLIKAFLAHNNFLALEEIDLEADGDNLLQLTDLLNLLKTDSLFNPEKLIVLYNLSSRNDLRDNIELICQSVTDNISLIIIEPNLKASTKFGKFLIKHPAYEKCETYTDVKLRDWLCHHAKNLKTQLDRPTADYLIQYVGSDATALNSEVQKLSVYPVITKELINELVAPTQGTTTIFNLLDVLFKGQLEKALILYEDQLRQKSEPFSILNSFVWQFQLLAIVKTHKSSTAKKIALEFGIHFFPLERAKSLAANISLKKLNKLIELCRQTDQRIRGDFIDPNEAILFLIVKICQIIKY